MRFAHAARHRHRHDHVPLECGTGVSGSRVVTTDQQDCGIATNTPDGIGDACQCGDVTGNGIVTGQDANAIKRHALGDTSPIFAVPGNCDVSGNGFCNGQDANAVKRAALGQRCHNALGTPPVPPNL